MTVSSIDSATVQAYRETDFHVHCEPPLTLKVGIANPSLAALHRANQVTTSAFITACNPCSESLDATTNATRQATLAEELHSMSLSFTEGIGQHSSNQWPGEESFLVLGVSLQIAKTLGVRHGQNAIVWCGSDAVPELILLR